ncbi:MAG TPA: double-strand break repair helicase AddA [Stellaceae bacterium]|nr:double-strand break repair helicase AddA [Stellaceae bacterium]
MVAGAAAAADYAQRWALDPAASVWVSASAGTGKTKVLTERLLTLMLDGTEPSRILCLTFTRAAAAEMANRLNDRLAKWTTMPSGALAQELVALTGRYPQDDDIRTARRLFSRVLDTPGGAKIETIHAFCQSLLRRFPLEAGVPPDFRVIEERSAKEALNDAAAQIIAAARAGARSDLAEALAVVARYLVEERFAELMAALAKERGKLAGALAAGEAALTARLAAAASVAPGLTLEALTERFCAGGDLPMLRQCCAALAAGTGKTDQPRGRLIARWCEDAAARAAMVDDYLAVFLTDEGDVRARLCTQSAAKAAAIDLAAVLAAEAERVKRYLDARNALVVIEATRALVRLGAALVEAYETRKRLHAELDYDDLVLKALDLLRRDGIAPWVLFKLDGGLDHILIDEAQDTNPEQWEIVAILAAEFFAGEDPLGRQRTVFAVGDAKQSIYSFQRADPRAFGRMREHFQERVVAAQQAWRPVALEVSFRAAAPLLQAVDAVFALDAAADGVGLDREAIRHVAARVGQTGLVELWPGAPPAPDEGDDPLAPEPARRPAPAHTRLARAVAATIDGWLKHGELLPSRDRHIRAGDIMVLVRRRNAFVDDLLRELKQRGVPVAGADRLTLSEQLAVKDLVALGEFLLLPEDDLTLAVVLKGPLFGISEEQLFTLAYDRGGRSLWSRLLRLGADDLLLSRAVETLRALLARADYAPPYELYADILGAGGGRRAMLERLGPEAEDPIEEFLALALTYEREHVPSLQGFLHWLIAGDIEVKRDLAEQQRDELRIMTVHGAKGLEAPVVFIPDTMQLPDPRGQLLWTEADDLPLWRPHRRFNGPHYAGERQAQRRRELQEYRRLLYVALTRAQDRLYVCGWQTRNGGKDAETWHTLCRAGLSGIAESFAFDSVPLIGETDGWAGDGWRLTSAQEAAPSRDSRTGVPAAPGPLPEWLTRPAPQEPDPPKPLLPSQPSGGEPPTLSPLATGGRDRFKRGLLVHRLLQTLPELAAGERAAAARRFLALPVHALPPDEQEDIRRETLAVLDTPEFAALWGPDAQAEVPVVGLIGGRALSGQIDRIVVTPDRVLIVDYKTVRPPPGREDEVSAVYLQQLASYRAALERIYPDRSVRCAILWTEAPRLMPISPDLLARHLP